MSQITTHVLDTSLGQPAKGITIELLVQEGAEWRSLAKGVTNADGRISDLLGADDRLSIGIYKMVFHVRNYFAARQLNSFYPNR